MLDWFRGQLATFPAPAFPLLAAALLISALGFYRVVYFVSIGYGFSIAAMALLALVLLREQMTALAALHALLLLLYGLRLGTYLVRRERNPSYAQAQAADNRERAARVKPPLRVVIWLTVAALYLLMFSPGLFHLADGRQADSAWATVAQVIGPVVMAAGLALEALADKQKSDFKARQPRRFCDVGLYRVVRSPNYLGEIIFWLGSFIAGLPFYTSALRWLAALVGLVSIVLIMLGSTKRLERTQEERYGQLPEYQQYIRTVPVLFPFVPLYTLKNVKVYLE